MQQREYQWLCNAIRQKCGADHWYGPEFQSPTWAYMVAVDNPQRRGFKYPPATEEELRGTEAILDFSLPPILRALYTKLANGGFGPAYGMRGISGGAPEEAGTVITWYKIRAEILTFIDLEGDEVKPGKDFSLADPFWPRFLLPIFNWGCGIDIGVDCRTNHVLQIDPMEKGYHLTYLADSLEEWLQKWIRGELYPQRVITPQEALAAKQILHGEQTSDFF